MTVEDLSLMIVRQDDILSSAELKARLESEPTWDQSIRLQMGTHDVDIRPIDPTFLSAIAAGSAALAALLASLVRIAESIGKQKITIHWEDGTALEVQAWRAKDLLPTLIPLLESKSGSKIVVSL